MALEAVDSTMTGAADASAGAGAAGDSALVVGFEQPEVSKTAVPNAPTASAPRAHVPAPNAERAAYRLTENKAAESEARPKCDRRAA